MDVPVLFRFGLLVLLASVTLGDPLRNDGNHVFLIPEALIYIPINDFP